MRYNTIAPRQGPKPHSARLRESRFFKSPITIREVQFSGIERGYFQSLVPGSVSLFPAIGKPDVDVVYRPRGKIRQQLHELELWIHLVPAAAAGQAGQGRCGPSSARVSDEQRVLAVQIASLAFSVPSPFVSVQRVVDEWSRSSNLHVVFFLRIPLPSYSSVLMALPFASKTFSSE
jgi:hypothetical protein